MPYRVTFVCTGNIYEGHAAFEEILAMIEAAVPGLPAEVRQGIDHG